MHTDDPISYDIHAENIDVIATHNSFMVAAASITTPSNNVVIADTVVGAGAILGRQYLPGCQLQLAVAQLADEISDKRLLDVEQGAQGHDT